MEFEARDLDGRVRNTLFSSIFRHCALLGVWGLACMEAAEWQVPMGGNAYVTEGAEGRGGRWGGKGWSDEAVVRSVYFRVEKAADLELGWKMKVEKGESVIRTVVGGKRFETKVSGAEEKVHPVGRIRVDRPGYVRVDVKGVKKEGEVFGEIQDLVVSSETEGLELVYVKSNEGNMFYWGRRGPSVHLGYTMPQGVKVEYGYSELTVPVGEDPAGSYYMANGFGQGYFGIQVKGPEERWVLFSVWSPFSTDDPKKIPADQRVELLAKGDAVRVGEFGNEGSGGQSYWVYPWKSGVTYKFLTRVHPDGKGSTIYTAWMGEKGKSEWSLVASFRRPKTDTYYTGFHSFLENFYDQAGFRERRGLHGNVWVCDVAGKWHEITEARFTGDATAGGRHRLDYAGGVEGKGWFMRNGGFFSDKVELNQRFTRPSTAAEQPKIDFSKLPGNS